MLPVIRTLCVFLWIVHVCKGGQDLDRVFERLDDIENDLRTEQRHRREDVKALKEQLKSLLQTCACDKTVTTFNLAVVNNRSEVRQTPTDAIKMPGVAESLRLAFQQEKLESIKLRNSLTEFNDTLTTEIRQIQSDVTKNITETQLSFTEEHKDAMLNMTQFVARAENRMDQLHLDTQMSITSMKTSVKTTMNETIKQLTLNIDRNFSEEKLGLINAHNTFVQNMTHFIRRTERNVSNFMSEMNVSINNLRKDVDKTMANVGFVLTKGKVDKCPSLQFESGLYQLSSGTLQNTIAYCDTQTGGGGWIVFQRRQDGSEEFFRDWEDYKHGFGLPKSEFWWGLENLHLATKDGPRELRIDIEDFSGNKAYAHYLSFRILSESQMYAISVSGYSGTARDALTFHDGTPFTTKDRDHDSDQANCAERWNGAWWFKSCFRSHLNGEYQFPNGSFPVFEGPIWVYFNRKKALKFTEMKLR